MYNASGTGADVRATFLGRPRVEVGGSRIERRLRPNTMVLLAMLLTQCGEGLSRDELAFNLWPEACEREARTALRRHVYLLRCAVPDADRFLRCDTKSIGWDDPCGAAWVDVERFEGLGGGPDSAGPALDLYAGDFLTHNDHEWVEAKRGILRDRFCAILLAALRDRRNVMSDHDRLRYAERLLGLDPWREDVLRETLILRSRVGDRAGAVAAYRRFCRNLFEELEIEPMSETVRVYESIVRGDRVASSAELLAFERSAS